MRMYDFVQLTNHIQHQLAEAGRDANPISAMFDSLAHPQLDTHRGEYPTFLEWRHSTPSHSSSAPSSCTGILDSPPPTPTINQNRNQSHELAQLSIPTETSTTRPHIVLGRGEVGGIWADMGHDHNQTLSYNEHMELPLYSFADFIRDNPEHDKNLDRPLRSTVSAYYKAHVQHTGIQSNFSNYTTVTGIYHLKDMEHHCCCTLDPCDSTKDKQTGFLRHSRLNTEGSGSCQSCAPYRYAILGHVDSPSTRQHSSKSARTKFMIRAKTVVLATGTFDQPKKLPAAKADPCALPASPTAMIQQTFHDTRQLEEWMRRHDGTLSHRPTAIVTSPPPSPSSSSPSSSSPSSSSPSSSSPSKLLATTSTLPSWSDAASTLPIVIVGTGLSAADAILLIHEKQPWRRVIHIYKHFSASEPSPLKRCHRDVYPEYNSIWMRMKRFATLKNSVQSYQHPKVGEQPCRIFGNISKQSTCEPCKQLLPQEGQDQYPVNEFAPLCSTCSYKGLPDASVSSWNPVTGQIVLVLSHGVVIQEQVAAVGVFIGKQVHMGFLKGSLAQEMLASPPSPLGDNSAVGLGHGVSLSGMSSRRRSSSQADKELAVDIPTPPCTPPRSPTLRPAGALATTTTARQQFWHKQALESLRRCRKGSFSSVSSSVEKEKQESEEGCSQDEQQGENNQEDVVEEEEEEEDEQTDPSQVLTLLNPLVSDMYNFRLIPTGIVEPVVAHRGPMVSSSSLIVLPSSGVSAGTSPTTRLTPAPTFPTKAKKCSRLPCYPIRRPSLADPTMSSSSTTPESERTEIATATTVIGAATMGDEARGGGGGGVSLSNAASRVGKSIKAMSSACISMPCSPLLGSRVVCPTLPTPPLFSLYTAAANVLTNSMTALTPRCSLISASAAAAAFSSTSSSSALSSRRSSRCSRSSSISSLALSTTTPLDSSSGAVVVASAAAAVDGTQAVAAVGVANLDEPNGGAVAVGITDDIKVEEERRSDYSHDDQSDNIDGLVEDDGDEDDEDEEEVVVEDVTPYPPPATPAEKLIEARMDHSIYAAGAITGSKFVRYVLGNGVAIVADILRSEVV
ncbi:Oxidative stress-induced growth inhibitor 2 [Linnemannia gamsii]|uniref:Oxidative stress-induced growth inhibitor 2 n=1 Tax=Linnemannia gamsii TaxID=64522 RepID=A0ABQ7JY04_9FUNG|nr:Oxidative stress-induced growth inhibitor 2 [Linnemannia gamsii]